MDFKELHYVMAIAKYKNVSKAAEALGISQPSLSKYIHNLEDYYEARLFQYVEKTFQLTYAGNLYVQTAEKILNHARDLSGDVLRDDSVDRRKTLRICCPMLKSKYILPNIVPQFKLKCPDVTLIVREVMENAAEKMLLDDMVDISITNHVPKDSRIQYESLLNEEILMIVSKQNPLVNEAVWKSENGGSWIDIKLFKHESFILPAPEQKIRQVVDRVLQMESITPNILLETRSFETAFLVAASGAGVAFVPKYFVHTVNSIQKPMAFSIGNGNTELRSVLAYKKDYAFPKEAEVFIKSVKDFMA